MFSKLGFIVFFSLIYGNFNLGNFDERIVIVRLEYKFLVLSMSIREKYVFMCRFENFMFFLYFKVEFVYFLLGFGFVWEKVVVR